MILAQDIYNSIDRLELMLFNLNNETLEREIIIDIKEVSDYNLGLDSWDGYDGYKIITNKQNILLLISNGQSCCEDWGYLMSEDKLEDFFGAELLKIEIVDTALKVYEEIEGGVYDGNVMFINLTTNRGVLQFVAYNSHNGYYGHSVKVISNQLTHDDYL